MSLQDLWQWPPSPAVVQRWETSRARGPIRYITRNTLWFAGPMFILMMVFHTWDWMHRKSPHPASFYISETKVSLFIALLFGIVIGGTNWVTLKLRLARLGSRSD